METVLFQIIQDFGIGSKSYSYFTISEMECDDDYIKQKAVETIKAEREKSSSYSCDFLRSFRPTPTPKKKMRVIEYEKKEKRKVRNGKEYIIYV